MKLSSNFIRGVIRGLKIVSVQNSGEDGGALWNCDRTRSNAELKNERANGN